MILVSGAVSGEYVSGFKRYYIKRNDLPLCYCFASNSESVGYLHGALPAVVSPVNYGDTIQLFGHDQETILWGNGGTYLTVVQIG